MGWQSICSERRIQAWSLCLALAALLCLPAVNAAWAQGMKPSAAPGDLPPTPPDVEDLNPVEKLQQQVPPELLFTDEKGNPVRLGDYFNKDRPIILNLQYFSCPMLCGVIMNGMTEGLKHLAWTAGQEFEILSVSFDARENSRLAMLKKQNYLREYERPAADKGWHFLVGKEDQIKTLCDAVGYRFRWDNAQNQFAHPAVLILLTPQGKVSRYLYGVTFDPTTLRLSLVEASQGKVGTTTDRILLYCFHYDAAEGRYTMAARRLMSTAGAVMILIMGLWLVPRWVRDWRQSAGKNDGPGPSEHGA